jgi:hypothetical protein
LIQPETIRGRKEYFRKKRAEFAATWITDDDGVVHIPFGDGHEALIDADKKELAAQFLWHLHPSKKKFYAEALSTEELREEYGKHVSLHRVIMGVSKGVQVDHIHGNGLDCRCSEMRVATSSQNAANRKYKSSTGYRGVVKKGKKFAAQIEHNGKNNHLGICSSPEEAAVLYNLAAVKLFGNFAVLNEIEG